jgi:hypothetical protein
LDIRVHICYALFVTKFHGTIEFLSGQSAAIVELTTETGEWAGSGRVEVSSGRRADLYEAGYNTAALSARAKGGRLEQFGVRGEAS